MVQLRQLNQTGRRRVADSAQTNFVPARWQSYVIDADGRIDRRYYELCALWELRATLRAGEVWVDGSRRYANPETYLIPTEQWPTKRAEACRLTGTPEDGSQRLRQRPVELEAILARLDGGFPQNEHVRLVGDDLIISSVRGEDAPASAEQLRDQVVTHLPDLLIEVDRWTGFSRSFGRASSERYYSHLAWPARGAAQEAHVRAAVERAAPR